MFNRLSIRYKLLVLLGASLGVGLLISSGVALYTTFVAEQQASLRTLRQVTAVTSENMRAALAFRDGRSAQKILHSLQADPHIQYAVALDERGSVLAQYQAASISADRATRWHKLLLQPSALQQHMDREFHYVIYPIDLEGSPVGRLAVLSDNQAMYTKMRRYMVLQIGVTVLIFAGLLLLSWRLQLIFTQPITQLVQGMRHIGSSKDYSTTLHTDRTDEFGELYQGFNAMLREVRVRDEKLSHLATTDPLTGLANRRFALETMQTLAAQSERNQTPLGVILLDVDHFKQVNDTYGHPVGDLILQQVAHLLQASIRAYDIAARFGGEEFLVLCADTDVPTTVQVAERIRTVVAEQVFTTPQGATLRVTVSLGVQASITTPEAMMQLVEAADQALYCAKQAGRNRVVAHTEGAA